ncbi:hypothetical protein [Mesoterricola silvestris]|uniref:Uncharacterized protein n=1 Tax=Mesoterricola silvestris TaxID=2927979 RepID=A0AA48H2S5_9BACT|nr:hypothetical protein [Mesoterricola silvestris]BDU70863.1 hypothetical protein METEAL_00370 [Mesoterricola silvestris]
MTKSGKQIGDEYSETLAQYLEALRKEGKALPSRAGKVSAKGVALASGIETQSLYKNVKCRAMLEAAAQELGLAPMETREAGPSKDDAKDRRIQTLEARNAVLQAEVEGLRQKLRRYAHIEEHMVSTGRRVIP